MNNRVTKVRGIHWRIFAFVILFVFLIALCPYFSRDYLYKTIYGIELWLSDAKYDLLDLERQILDFWGTKEVIDIMLGEVDVKEGRIKVYARTVTIYGDTLYRLLYRFDRYRSGFRLSKKLKFEKAYKWKLKEEPYTTGTKDHFIRVIGLKNVKYLRTIVNDIHSVVGLLEIFAAYTKGKYPAHLNVKVREIPGYCKGVPYEYTVLEIAETGFHEEIFLGEAIGDTWEWFPEYKGKIVYFPLDIRGKAAMRFIVKGSTDTGFIDYEMRNLYGYKDPWEISDERIIIK